MESSDLHFQIVTEILLVKLENTSIDHGHVDNELPLNDGCSFQTGLFRSTIFKYGLPRVAGGSYLVYS